MRQSFCSRVLLWVLVANELDTAEVNEFSSAVLPPCFTLTRGFSASCVGVGKRFASDMHQPSIPNPKPLLQLRGGTEEEAERLGDIEDCPDSLPEANLWGYQPAFERNDLDVAQRALGRILDAYAPKWQRNTTIKRRTREEAGLWKPVFRSDWRGDPLTLANNMSMSTRSEAVKRYNQWVSREDTEDKWTQYDFDKFGEIYKRNLSADDEQEDDDEEYGRGGRPGWLGWGAVPIRDLVKWLREGSKENITENVREREAWEEKTYGWAPATTEVTTEEQLLKLLEYRNVTGARSIVKELGSKVTEHVFHHPAHSRCNVFATDILQFAPSATHRWACHRSKRRNIPQPNRCPHPFLLQPSASGIVLCPQMKTTPSPVLTQRGKRPGRSKRAAEGDVAEGRGRGAHPAAPRARQQLEDSLAKHAAAL
eukprot:3787017-Rhodomonas_salina.1